VCYPHNSLNFCTKSRKINSDYSNNWCTTNLCANSPSKLERIFVYFLKILGKRRQHFASFIRRINVRKEKYRTVCKRTIGNKPAEKRDQKHRRQ